jgi:hypothetical protein
MLREVKEVDADETTQDEGREERTASGWSAPLACDATGDTFDVPEEAAGWRVKRSKPGSAGGAPEIVYENARPLTLPLSATHDDLIQRVGGKPGRYRLDLVSAEGRAIKDVPPGVALIEARASAPEEPSSSTSRDPMMVEITRLLAQLLSETVRSHTTNSAKVLDNAGGMMAANASVTAAKIPRPGEIIREVQVGPEPVVVAGPDLSPIYEMFKPLAPMVGQWLWKLMANSGGGGAPPSASVESGL